MGFRFRKSFNLGAGLRLNVSTKGVGASWGSKWFRVGTGPSGTRAHANIPGTGLGWSTGLGGKKRRGRKDPSVIPPPSQVTRAPWPSGEIGAHFPSFGDAGQGVVLDPSWIPQESSLTPGYATALGYDPVTLLPTANPSAPPWACSYCGYQGHPDRASKVSTAGWVLFIVMGLACLTLPFCWVPLVCLKDHTTLCPRCHTPFGTM